MIRIENIQNLQYKYCGFISLEKFDLHKCSKLKTDQAAT